MGMRTIIAKKNWLENGELIFKKGNEYNTRVFESDLLYADGEDGHEYLIATDLSGGEDWEEDEVFNEFFYFIKCVKR